MNQWSKTERVPAEVIFSEGISLCGDLHLQPGSANHLGPETPLEMLNRPEGFFPLSLPSGEVALLAKTQTAVVICEREPQLPDAERRSIAKSVDLVVRMVGGTEYRGTAAFEMPPANSRALDFMNEPERFFALEDEATTWYINRTLVRHVHPQD
ncbi:MAG: hypothetical protein OER21_02545 [Gemmatimonadota bacterium]|nr:hypothetical protein [Gemmatimonadota bacterium]